MGGKARKKQEKQLKDVKRRLDLERKPQRGRKAYAMCLVISGVVSLAMAAGAILRGEASMLVSMCLMLGAVSLFLAYKIYDDEAKRLRKLAELEREHRDLLDKDEA